jgi:hypothetical protein
VEGTLFPSWFDALALLLCFAAPWRDGLLAASFMQSNGNEASS